MKDEIQAVKALITKAKEAKSAGEALHYSQAASNAAHALVELVVLEEKRILEVEET